MVCRSYFFVITCGNLRKMQHMTSRMWNGMEEEEPFKCRNRRQLDAERQSCCATTSAFTHYQRL